jgi:hypothetical protein
MAKQQTSMGAKGKVTLAFLGLLFGLGLAELAARLLGPSSD